MYSITKTLLLGLVLGALSPLHAHDGSAAVTERYITPSREPDNLDSIGIYAGAKQTLAIVTAKSSDLLLIYDAVSGDLIKQVGGTGKDLGKFSRPNGILVLEDLVFVVERDNHRVQVLRLPELTPIGIIGEDVLRKPYGLSAYRLANGSIRLYVTDDYEIAATAKPEAYGERIKLFELNADSAGVKLVSVRSFGETGKDRLFKVESIMVDVANERLFICDEQGPSVGIKVYDLEGKYSGNRLNAISFKGEPEGLALVQTSERGGYLIATDQQPKISEFHVLDRNSLKPLGAFYGQGTANTDGIVIHAAPLQGLDGGGLWAIHDDQALVNFDWAQVRKKLKLP